MKKKIIVTSLMTIILSAGIVSGATYALFTSESKVNIAIGSATVKATASINEDSITLYSMDEKMEGKFFQNGGTVEYLSNEGLFKIDRMTPGDKINFNVDIENESNIAVNYRINTYVTGGLTEYLATTATILGKTGELKIDSSNWVYLAPNEEVTSIPVSIELPVSVENDAQNLGADVAFTIELVQANGVDSLMPKGKRATPENIDEVLANASEGDTIALSAGYYDEINLTQNKLTITGEDNVYVGFLNANSKDECTIDGLNFDASNAQPVYNPNSKTYTGIYANVVGTGESNSSNAADNLTIKNCNFIGEAATNVTADNFVPIAFYERGRSNGPIKNVTIDNNVFASDCAYFIYGYYPGTGSHVITNNVFGSENAVSASGVYFGSNQGSVTLTGNTFINSLFIGTIHSSTYKYVTVTVTDNKYIVDSTEDFTVLALRYYTAYGAKVVFSNNIANEGNSTFKDSYVNSSNYECFDVVTK